MFTSMTTIYGAAKLAVLRGVKDTILRVNAASMTLGKRHPIL